MITKKKRGAKRKTNLLCRVKCDSFLRSIYTCLPECSSESFSSFISLAHPSSRRMLFAACCSACSNKPLRPRACGTWGVQLSVRSRLRKMVPSQNTRSVHCTRLPSSMHSRSRRTMWFAGKWGDMETSWCSTQKYSLYIKNHIEDVFFFLFFFTWCYRLVGTSQYKDVCISWYCPDNNIHLFSVCQDNSIEDDLVHNLLCVYHSPLLDLHHDGLWWIERTTNSMRLALPPHTRNPTYLIEIDKNKNKTESAWGKRSLPNSCANSRRFHKQCDKHRDRVVLESCTRRTFLANGFAYLKTRGTSKTLVENVFVVCF